MIPPLLLKQKKGSLSVVGSLLFVFFGLLIFFNKSSVYAQDFPAPVHEISHKIHQWRNAAKKNLGARAIFGIITASDTLRSESGEIAEGLLKKEGYNVKEIVTVKKLDLESSLKKMLTDSSINIILCIGGTGISPHDVTIEAVNHLVQKSLPGFGEILRFLTYEKFKSLIPEIGILSLDTRATAGVYKDVLIFAIPGAPQATTLAIEEIIIPGIPTLLQQVLGKKCH